MRASQGLAAFLQNELFPTSFLQPFVDNKVLQVLVLAILTACSISFLSTRMRERAVAAIDGIAKVIFGIIKIIMWAAPLAAFGGMAYTVSAFGASSLANLGLLMLTFWGTCAFFVVVVLGAVSAWAGFNVFKLIRLIKDELLIIVGTSSSETVLPRLLTKLESAGASRQTVGLVIPTGYSFNLDGTCIYLTLGALFIIQAGGEQLGIGPQIALAVLMVLTSKGAAGVTGAGLVTLAASLQAFGGEFFTRRGDRGGHRADRRHRPGDERGPGADERDRQLRRDAGDRAVERRAGPRAPAGRARRPVADRRRHGAAPRRAARRSRRRPEGRHSAAREQRTAETADDARPEPAAR